MKPLTFRTVTEIQKAKYIWNTFSPHQTIDDEWDFRYTFYKYLKFPLHFIVGFDGDKPVGLLPLQLNTNKGISNKRFNMSEPFLEFFGGIDTDDNKVFLNPGYEHNLHDFLKQLRTTAVLAPLAEKYSLSDNESAYYTDKFVVDLEGLINLDTFVDANFEGKSRRRMRNRINHFNNSFDLKIKKGTDIDLKLLFELNKNRFGERSAFNMEHRKKIFRELSELFETDLFTIFINGVPKAASISVIHKGIYYGLNSGYDFEVRDLGKYVFLTKIQRAIEMGCKVFDAGKNDNGWKEHFHLQKIPQYKLELNVSQTQTSPFIPNALQLHREQFPSSP